MSDTSGVDHLIAVLNENCGDTPPVVTRSAAGCTISVTFTPPELDFEWDLQFTCTVVKRGGCDVIVAIDFSAPACIQKVQDLLVELRERVTPPFYIMTSDHARMFVKRTIYKDMEQEGWSEPPTWACPITLKSSHAGGGAAGAAADTVDFSEFTDPRYAKYIEWLDVPPSFPGNVTRGSHPGFANHIAVKVFMNDLKDLNRCNDMRCYFDEGDMTNCILKASPHLIFHIFAKSPDKDPKHLCESLDRLGLLGIEYHLRFSPDYPLSAPLVRVYRPHVTGGYVQSSGAVCTDALQPAAWKSKQSFETVFRSMMYLQGNNGHPMTASKDAVYHNEAEAHETTFKWLATVHSEWQNKKGI